METTTGDRNTLAHVDLTSTVSQITWGSMAAAQYTNPVIALKEINDSYDVVTIDYVMSCVDGKGETEYYNVREYFSCARRKAVCTCSTMRERQIRFLTVKTALFRIQAA